jgi:hypothetical protein
MVRADLRSQQTFTSVAFDAPKEGTQRGRLGWLMRQLKDAPDSLRLEAAFPNARSTTTATLGQIRQNPKALEYEQDTKRPPRAFVLTSSQSMGTKRGRAEGSFVRETGAQVVSFYSKLVQELKAWQAPAPKVHSAHPTEAVADDLPPSPVDEARRDSGATDDITPRRPDDGDDPDYGASPDLDP